MAKQQNRIYIRLGFHSIQMWCDDAPNQVREISAIEGVENIFINGTTKLNIFVDPRYDLAEVANEIKELMETQVPEVFQEE